MKKYIILEKIAQNDHREIYRAKDPLHERIVVIKTWTENNNNSQEIKNILKNKKNITNLRHPYIAPIYQMGIGKNVPFLVMQHVEGESLEKLIKNNISLKKSLEILAKIAMALNYAHRQGVIHGDIKPSNIIIDNTGEPKIIDFGFGVLSGTLQYMSPEQINKKRVDRRSDVYALGVMLYFLSAKKYPFDGYSSNELVNNILTEAPIAPSKINPSLSALFDNLCFLAMAKEKTKRCDNAKDFFLILSGKKNFNSIQENNNKHLLISMFILTFLIVTLYVFFYM